MQTAILYFFNDWPVEPEGANCGGGETATMALMEAMARAGHRVIACANLPGGDCEVRGVEYWNFGEDYDLAAVCKRAESIGDFVCIAATLAMPMLFTRDMPNCKGRIIINHSPGAVPSGIEPRTVMTMVDAFVCVSHAQRDVILSRGDVPHEKIRVIRNGFDPELFQYAGPENRDWMKLVFAGRLEPPKGVHHLIAVFPKLKELYPNLKLELFGESSMWPELHAGIAQLEAKFQGLNFHGKVPQKRIAEELQRAGCLVFPSISFESAGLSVLDAQASGCPVIASDIGGVSEYLLDGQCGLLVKDMNEERLYTAIAGLLAKPNLMQEMSRKALSVARSQTWDKVASEVLSLAESISQNPGVALGADTSSRPSPKEIAKLHKALYRTWSKVGVDADQLMLDHDAISSGEAIGDTKLFEVAEWYPEEAAFQLWQGLRLESLGKKDEARQCFSRSSELSELRDWQPMFRLTLLCAETGDISSARSYAELVLKLCPRFPLKMQLSELIRHSEQAKA